MYSYIKGIVTDINSNSIVLENNSIGYLIYTPNPYSFKLNDEVKIYLYQYIKENENTLYGFKTTEMKDMFFKLISVKGIGPKVTLPVLAMGSVSGIVDAIERENILYLKKFPKIGDKLARQIILDLKGKLATTGKSSDDNDDLIEVLKGLGYKMRHINNVITKIDKEMDLEDKVKEALKKLHN